MSKKLLLVSLFAILVLAVAGCNNSQVDDEDDDDYVIDRVMLTFSVNPDPATATLTPESTIENFMYYVSRGEYDTALKFCYMPDGTLFDENALQQAVLADGIGRGESITFYRLTCSNGKADFEYDLTLGSNIGTYNKKLYYIQSGGNYYIDLVASGYVASGKLYFQVPRYVDAYINGVYIDKKYLDANYCYTINTGVARIPQMETVKKDDGTTETKLADASITLTLKTNFGVEQSYPLSFLGTLRKAESVNETYFDTSRHVTNFTIDCPRELRESALTYISGTVLPTLITDLVKTHSWETAGIQKLFGTDTQKDAMFADYYNSYRAFSDNMKPDNGGYFYFDPRVYNVNIVERNKRSNTDTGISDWNVADFAIECDCNWLYTFGSDDTERNKVASLSGVVSLAKDEAGNWYVYNISKQLFDLPTR